MDKVERWPKEMKTWKIRNTSRTLLNQEPKPVVVSMDAFKVTQKNRKQRMLKNKSNAMQ